VDRALSDHIYDASGVIDSTGSADAYVVAIAEPVAAYHRGMPPIRFKANFANTGAATVNIATVNAPSGLGAVNLRKAGGATALGPGDIVSGGIYTLVYDGTNFQVPEIPARNSWQVLASSGVQSSHTGTTTQTTLATVTVPAGAMGPNGRLRITFAYSFTNSANNKIFQVRFNGAAGTAVYARTETTNQSHRGQVEIANRNAANSQVYGGGLLGSGGWGSVNTAIGTMAIDTASARDIAFTGELANAAESIAIESYLVELFYGA
jgi:hypothetical protein